MLIFRRRLLVCTKLSYSLFNTGSKSSIMVYVKHTFDFRGSSISKGVLALFIYISEWFALLYQEALEL